METNKKLSPIVTELFLRGRKLNFLLLFITQSYFKVLKTIRLITIHYFIMKMPDKAKLQQIASNYLSAIGFKYFMKIYKNYIKDLFSFLVNDTTFSSLRFFIINI